MTNGHREAHFRPDGKGKWCAVIILYSPDDTVGEIETWKLDCETFREAKAWASEQMGGIGSLVYVKGALKEGAWLN